MLRRDREQRLDELQALHSSLVLTVVQRHGVSAAMRLIGQTLTWLSTLPADTGMSVGASGTRSAQSPRNRFAENTESARERWRRLIALARQSPDPWARCTAEQALPLLRAIRRRLIDNKWVEDELVVRCEREPFTRGAMRHCHRVRVYLGPGRRSLNLVAKRYDPPDRKALEDDVQMQLRAKHCVQQPHHALQCCVCCRDGLTRSWHDRTSDAEAYVGCGVPKAIDYVQSYVLDIKSVGCFAAEACIEPGPAGEFIKFSSNSGQLMLSGKTDVGRRFALRRTVLEPRSHAVCSRP